jgi:hypothetical protein
MVRGRLNMTGGVIIGELTAESGITEMSAGRVNGRLRAYSTSTVNLSGGSIGSNSILGNGSKLNVTGGSFGRRFTAETGSNVKFSGGEFQLNGAPIARQTLTLTETDVLTGTLEDGFVFIFSPLVGDKIAAITLLETTIPTLTSAPYAIDSAQAPLSLRAGQSLSLLDGGALSENFAAVNAHLKFAGGVVGPSLEAVGSTIAVSGGTIGQGFSALSSTVSMSAGNFEGGIDVAAGSFVAIRGGKVAGTINATEGSLVTIAGGVSGAAAATNGSVINVTGGKIVGSFAAGAGCIVNVSKGSVGTSAIAKANSKVNVAGGRIGRNFYADSNSSVNIAGGEFGSGFSASAGSSVVVKGGTFGARLLAASGSVSLYDGEFLLNGIAPVGPTVTLAAFDLINIEGALNFTATADAPWILQVDSLGAGLPIGQSKWVIAHAMTTDGFNPAAVDIALTGDNSSQSMAREFSVEMRGTDLYLVKAVPEPSGLSHLMTVGVVLSASALWRRKWTI